MGRTGLGAGKAQPTMLIIPVNMRGAGIGALKLIMAKSHYNTDRLAPGKEWASWVDTRSGGCSS